MPFDRDVTIDFNADISGYSQSMGQMIQQTSQYSAAADGMIGKIGKLNSVVLSGVKSMAAFTGTNKVATAQAAAYQQQLSKIETSAKVNNKSFKELEKTTKSLAKDFPIGMKQAVQQVEALQEAGVTSNKEIKSLATTFTKLGAATGTFGPELGQNMLQLNRTFQNGTGSMEKYADSLTQVTHEFGANAGAVTSFAKSIAPVAATVGMNETSVIGLSTAFSRLGEDGYAAANTFNKVMLDMSKSIREGTPEAKIYAEVMGTSSEQLKETWESNPAEGFIDFVEAIKSQGTGGIRSLEMLGLEGVRTQKTIMALASSGNMREIVGKAQSSYGGGQTATAAETAMGGVNDQMTMLNETMAQTTATAGKPFLGFLEKVLGVANSLAKALSSLVESDAIQSLAKVVGIAGAAWGATKLFTGSALLGSLGLQGAKSVSRSAALADFRAGRAEGLTGDDDTRARQAGAYSRAYIGGPPGAEPKPGLLRRGVGGIRNLANVGGNLGAAYVRSSASAILKSLDEDTLKTPAGQALQQSVKDVAKPAEGGGFWKNRKVMNERMATLGTNFGALANQTGGMTNLIRAQQQNIAAAGKFWGRAAGAGARGLGSLGSMATMGLATGPAAVAAGGAAIVAGVGYKYIKGRKDEEEARERGGKDAYRMFNDFAEKAGIATKGLVSFSQVLSESTAKIAAESKTRGEAMEITEKEMIQAKSPGYERAYTTRGKGWVDELLPGHPSAQKEAARLRGMLGSNASPEALNRIQMDLINQFGKEFADKVTDALKKIYEGGEGGRPMTSKEVQKMLHEQAEESQFLGIFGTKESAEFTEMEEAERARAVSVERSVKGVDVEQAEGYRGAEAGLEALKAAAAAKPPEPTAAMYAATSTGVGPQDAASLKNVADTQAALELSVSELNLTTEEERKYREASAAAMAPQPGVYGMPGQPAQAVDVGTLLENAGMPEKAEIWRETTAAGGKAEGGYQGLTQAEMDAMAVSPMEDAATKAVQRTTEMGGVAGTLATDMAGSAKAYRDWTKELGNGEKTFEDWVNAGSEGATDLQKAYAEVKNMPGDAAKQAALSSEIVKDAVKQASESGTGAAGAGQIITTAMTTSTGEELPALQAARVKAMQEAQLQGGQSTLAQQQGVIDTGRIAEEGLLRTDITAETRAQYETDAAAGKQAQLGRMQQMQQFMTQMTRQQEDFNKNRGRMEQSFQLQQQYAAEDYGKQRKYMIQDYHTSVLNAEADFNKQRMRAQRDFDKQVKRQAEQTAKNMFDPYQRIAPQMVTDIGVLQQSLLEQNQSVQQQLGSVDMLSKMGLSKDAIDQLKLMDPSQNAQVQRMLSDAMSDPTAINKINDLIKTRLKLGTQLSTSEYNKDFQNMKDDFGQSMDDMSEDFETNMERGEKAFKRGLRRNGEAFATAQSRAAAAHALALSQMDEDNQQAITRSQEDLVGMAEGFTDSYVDVQRKFLQDLADLPSNLSPATKTAITKVLEDEIDAVEAANTRASNAASASAAMSGTGIGGTGGEGGEDMQGVDGPTAGVGHYSGNWRNYRRGGFHGGADIGAPHGTPTYAVVDGRVKYTKRMTSSYGIHALISDGRHDFLYGHMSALHVNAGDKVHPGTQVGKVGSTGNSTGNHLHFEVRPAGAGHGSAINPGPWLATGGIVTKHIQPHVGEGGPEAVIPLNDKGMRYLADAINKSAMGRYWNPLDAQGSRSASHSSPVTNNVYTYDQRTQFTGSVEVKSQDPEDMARKLAARERRNRLARKTGSAA